MSRAFFRVGLAIALVWVVSVAVEVAPAALAKVPVFRVRDHDFVGLRYLTPETVLRTAGIGPDASVWDEATAWEERLERHPLVREARIRRRFPTTLVVEVDERIPVGLVPTPTLEPVDAEGRYLPLDPSRFPLDFPVLRPRPAVDGNVTPPHAEIRELAAAAAVMRTEPDFWSEISEIGHGPQGGIVVRRGQPEVVFHFPPKVDVTRVREALAVLRDAEYRGVRRPPESVDLRFAGYVYPYWGREAEQ
ncbi:MAG: FtsQ-type POTRA domain-containing protein [Gemmatimonadales bacterium]|nr:MAG: FtsQ-type POTRA domain-containing protein [Gemmatimonadales bacterium]